MFGAVDMLLLAKGFGKPHEIFLQLLSSCELEDWTGDLNVINEMVVQDAEANKKKGAKVFWWIDVAAEKVDRPTVDKYGRPLFAMS